jgi:Glycosyltransferase family 9 (heptosyltransferase)
MSAKLKALARSSLPKSLSELLRGIRREARQAVDWILALGVGARFFTTQYGLPGNILFFGLSPGDDLLCTIVLRELRQRGSGALLMMSNFPELFEGNRDAAYVVPAGPNYDDNAQVRRFHRFADVWGCSFTELKYAPFDLKDNSAVPRQHIVAELCASAGMTGRVAIRPYLILTEREKELASWAAGKIAIQSSGLAARHAMMNKQWYVERFQAVVDGLCDEFDFVQVGSETDPLLDHVIDLRGRTSIRESAALLHNSRLFVGTVGFLMHLARAAECPAVIVYGGREAPWQSGYVCNTNLYTALPCAPCWRWNTCDIDRQCMKEITVDRVTAAVREMAGRPRGPLVTEEIKLIDTGLQLLDCDAVEQFF